ncbi:MAG: hypothetical protein ACH36H_03350 [Candidatus Nanopelagicales bacterium]
MELTISALREDTDSMAEDMLDGFDPSDHREGVEQRWGAAAYRQGNDWWQSMTNHERSDWRRQSERLRQDWIDAAGDPSTAANYRGRTGAEFVRATLLAHLDSLG